MFKTLFRRTLIFLYLVYISKVMIKKHRISETVLLGHQDVIQLRPNKLPTVIFTSTKRKIGISFLNTILKHSKHPQC